MRGNATTKGVYNMTRLILMIISGALGGYVIGYHNGVVAGALLYLDDAYPGISIESKSVKYTCNNDICIEIC